MGWARRIEIAALSILLASPSFASAQPLPPPPPGLPDYVKLLDEAYNGRNLRAYADLFHDDVKVYVQGRLVATDRDGLVARIRSEFDRNLHLRTLSWAQGNQVLVMEEVVGCIPPQPDPHTVYHGCKEARAVRYDLAEDHKIEAVHFLEAERAWNMHAGAK